MYLNFLRVATYLTDYLFAQTSDTLNATAKMSLPSIEAGTSFLTSPSLQNAIMNHEMPCSSRLMHGQRPRDTRSLLETPRRKKPADRQLHMYAIDHVVLRVHQENASGKQLLEGLAASFQCWPRNHWTRVPRACDTVPDKRLSLHNHAPSQHPSAHPTHRKLSKEDVAMFSSLSNAGVAPKEIGTYIRQDSDSLATQQDIYNGIAAIRREICEGQSTIHALANQLDKEVFWSRMQFAPDGRGTAVLFAHPDSLLYL